MPRLILLFNHHITRTQLAAAHSQLGVQAVLSPPEEIQAFWSNIPPDVPELEPLMAPVYAWLDQASKANDFVLIQGDFGACFLLVAHALAIGLQPVYSTTARQASEEHQEDGSVQTLHRFQHVTFRKYGV